MVMVAPVAVVVITVGAVMQAVTVPGKGSRSKLLLQKLERKFS
jgi:hypothetical protein